MPDSATNTSSSGDNPVNNLTTDDERFLLLISLET
jgi:hypothetical protein